MANRANTFMNILTISFLFIDAILKFFYQNDQRKELYKAH